MDAAGAPADFNVLHNAAGCTGVLVFVPETTAAGVLLNNYGTTSNNGAGFLLRYFGATDGTHPNSIEVTVAGNNGSGYSIVTTTYSASGSAPPGRPCVVEWDYDATLFRMWVNGVLAVSVAPASPGLTTVGPPFTPRFGAYAHASLITGGASFLFGFCAIYARKLTDAERGQVKAYAAQWAAAPALGSVVATAPASTRLTGTVRLLPLGDSTVLGFGTTGSNGWRGPLVTTLAAAPFVLDCVGPYSNGAFADNQHDGVNGATVLNGALDAAPSTYPGHSPQASPAWAGTVDHYVGAGASTLTPVHVFVVSLGLNFIAGRTERDRLAHNNASDLYDLLVYLRTQEPTARFLVLAPNNVWSGYNLGEPELIDSLCDYGIPTLVKKLQAAGVPAWALDQRRYIAGLSDTSDGKHHSDAGDAKLGPAIAQAVRYVCGWT
jgi:hypothetical protein